MFDSIQELIIDRYQKYNSNVMIDAGIGSDLNSFRERVENVKRLMKHDQGKAAMELENMVSNVMMIMSGSNPELNSFIVLIKSINGKKVIDEELTESGIEQIKKNLSKKRLRMDTVREFMNYFKKKVEWEFEVFFPVISKVNTSTELYVMLKKKIQIQLREVINGIDLSEDLIKVENFFIKKMKPRQYGGAGGMEVKMINGFDDMCTVLIKNNLAVNPKKLTVVEFYNKLTFLEKLIKDSKKK
ncbi:MAG: putative structural protein [Prokaryotic dsDNA virus sp.]|nr:MAG: putative structural protein [Prokaryotic dsDNA virus sp.]